MVAALDPVLTGGPKPERPRFGAEQRDDDGWAVEAREAKPGGAPRRQIRAWEEAGGNRACATGVLL